MDPVQGYQRRDPEQSLLYSVIASELETFLAGRRRMDRDIPVFVEREFREYLDCGILARGFLHLRCGGCGKGRVLGFSCKRRGFCPSCGGRRMAETAAHLVERVFPDGIPVRQWVLSMPFSFRYRLAFDAALTRQAAALFVRAVFGFMRARARDRSGCQRPRCGAVLLTQRFSSDLRLNPHFHLLCADGVWTGGGDALAPEFHALPGPDVGDVADVAADAARRIRGLMEKSGAGADAAEADRLSEDCPGLADLAAASVQGRTLRGKRQAALGSAAADGDPEQPSGLCAQSSGFSLHAGTVARDRSRLESLCRYVARPALAAERLRRLPDGRLAYRLKRPWRDGTTEVAFAPEDLLARLAALVPPPRAHATRYYGVFAPGAAFRSRIVPPETDAPAEPCAHGAEPQAPARPKNYTWALLMRKVFGFDALKCPDCGGSMKIIAAIENPEVARKILECLGLPSRAPPASKPRPDPHVRAEL